MRTFFLLIAFACMSQISLAQTNGRPSTKSVNVDPLPQPFLMAKMGKSRRVWVYLPKSYNSSKKRYPVLYMQDGQNLFDDATSYVGEWGVDEYLDSLQTATAREVIVVGIDHAGNDRMKEYNPYDHEKFGKGQGEQYATFIVRELMPFINFHYRTLTDRENTAIAGSSMGALISQYTMLRYPSTFGIAGIFSPAYWTAPKIYDYTQKRSEKMKPSTFWLYAGGKEGETMVADMQKMKDILLAYHGGYIKSVVDAEAQHNEAAWRKHFPEFFQFAFGPKE